MPNSKQIFYEKVYREENQTIKLRSTIGRLYLLLKKYEVYREDVAYELAPGGKQVLDIGCGNGSLAIRFLSKYGYSFGCDIARTRLSQADKKRNNLGIKNIKRLKFLVADADDKLPFAAGSFDTVTMIATLEHFFDPYHVIKEVTRILKRGGTIIIQVPNLGFLPRRIAVLLGNIPVTSEDEEGWDGGHLHYFTVGSLKNLILQHGYSINKITCSGVFSGIRRQWVSLSGADIFISARKK